MSLRRSATNAALWGLAQKWGQHGTRLLVFVVLARLLDPESFGLVALANVFVLLADMLINQGFGDALVQRRRISRAHLDAAFWTNVGVGMALAAVLFVGAAPVAAMFGEPGLAPVLRMLAPVLVVVSLSRIHEALLRRRLAFKRIASIGLAGVAAGAGAGVAMALAGFGVWSLVGQILVQRLVELPCLWWATGWRPRARFSPPHFRMLFRFGRHVLGINLLNFVNSQADHLLIGYFLGSTALGYYTVGYRLVRILLDLVPQALAPVAFSVFSRVQGEPERMRQGLYEGTQAIALVALPSLCGMAVLAPELVPALFGAHWAASVPVMQIRAVAGALQSVGLLLPAAMKALGRPGRSLALTAVNAAGNLVAFSIAVHWGIVAVAIAFTVRAYLLWPLTWLTLNRLLATSFRRYLRALRPALAGVAVMAAAVLALKAWLPTGFAPPAVLALAIPAGALVYAATILVTAPGLLQRLSRLALRGGTRQGTTS